VLKSLASEVNGRNQQIAQKSVLQLSMTPQHDTPCILDDEAFVLSFKSRNGDVVTNFNLLPASKAELRQLALFLGTCANFHASVTHEIVPGQHIASVPTFDGQVEMTLSTDSDLVDLLGDPVLIKSLTVTLNIDQLEAYEEFITSAIVTNEAIHAFNFSVLDTFRQLQLAS
jgi:hypothetical protein